MEYNERRLILDARASGGKNSRAFSEIRPPISAVIIPQNSRDYSGRSTVIGKFDFTTGMPGMRNAYIYQICCRKRSIKIIQLIIVTLFESVLCVMRLFDYDANYISWIFIIVQNNQHKTIKGTKRRLLLSAAEMEVDATRRV